jgi:N-acetylglutamate synthase
VSVPSAMSSPEMVRGLLASLAGWVGAHAAGRMYLQVERDNIPALRLYERTGFSEICGYHYCTAG